MSESNSIYIVYQTTNLVNQMIYIGVHKQKQGYDTHIFDGYLGSGLKLIIAINKYGEENFVRETLFVFYNSKDAYLKEAEIVDEKFIKETNNYNIMPGGWGGWSLVNQPNTIAVKDKHKNYLRVDKNDPRYLSGELVGVVKHTAMVKDDLGKCFRISCEDPRYLSGELVSNMKNLIQVKDVNGNIRVVSKDDPDYLSGKLKFVFCETVMVKNKDGKNFRIDKNDPRYLSGELVGHTKGKMVAKDKKGDKYYVSVDDPRVLSGELVNFKKGHKYEQKTCPHCNKTGGGPNMTRHHFDNCKNRT